ncbi:ATP synthase subunit O, mitochondrial [Podarcis lilfordi]|uniref:ATP synthase peripheral stalk subunit OSCP, mitochondrial n=1 Tax=Podarcis lilfordi TaxID=74358 RepID=A0AA35K7N7_9SAUR|nr:ATP synthase subunit O, mitochondrial [Podarcis lilfordi]
MAAAAAAGLAQKVRHFSTSLIRPASKLIQPPIQVFGLEGRYATALYSAASKQKKLDQVEKELTRVLTLLKDPKLSVIVMNPHVKSAVKQKTVNEILAKEKMSPVTVNFINLLAENGRLKNTPGVISAFAKIMSAFRGEVLCSVTTAQVSKWHAKLHLEVLRASGFLSLKPPSQARCSPVVLEHYFHPSH